MTGDKDMKQIPKDSFGWGPIVPKFLKGCKRLSCLAICFIFCSFLNGINLGALSVALTTLEKRYGFSSKVTGLVSAAANIGSVTTIIFLAPLGYQSHRPRMLACGAVVTAVSCLLRIMPHLLDGPYWLPDTIERMRSQHPLCQTSGNSTSCSKLHSSDTFTNTALVFLLLGQLAGGAGFSQIISFAPGIFTDHLADKKSGHAYIAASNVLGAVGISAGFLFGSVCLTIFVDIRTTIYIDYSNQEWIGAWWLMFAFTGTFLLIFAIILFAFPARVYDGFARKNLLDEERDSLKDSAGSTSSTSSSTRVQKRGGNCKNFLKKIKTFPGSLVKLVKNPAFNLFNFCTWSELFFMSGLCAFGPKVFEKDFDISSADAGLVMGTIVASGAVGGILGGGFVISKMSANPRALARTCAICSLVAATCSCAYFFRCDETKVAGIHMSYNHTSFPSDSNEGKSRLIDECNVGCDCQISTFSPVCGPDGVTYFSACHAGCDFAGIDRDRLMLNFTNCACVRARNHRPMVVDSVTNIEAEPDVELDQSQDTEFTVTDGKCLRNRCNSFYPFFVILLFGIFVRAVIIPPLTVLILKCVPDDEKVFALGANFLSSKALGAVPGPIILGSLIDKTCLIWQETCENTGHCWMYKNTDLNLHLCFIWLGTSIVSTVTCFCASLLVPGDPSSPTRQEQQSNTNITNNKDNQKSNTDIFDNKDNMKSESSDEIYEPISN